MGKVQLFSDYPLQPFLFYLHLTFYLCSAFILPFILISDIFICFPTNISQHTIIRIEDIFYEIRSIFFTSSWLMFNVILFVRLHFTFEDSIYQMSSKYAILSIAVLVITLLIFVTVYTLLILYAITTVAMVLYLIGFFFLLIFSQFVVFMFVRKLFSMNLMSLINNTRMSMVELIVHHAVQSSSNNPTINNLGPCLALHVSTFTPTSVPTPIPTSACHFSSTSGISFEDGFERAVTIQRRHTINLICADRIQLITKYILLAILSEISSMAVFILCVGWFIYSGIMDFIEIAFAVQLLLNVVCVTFAFKNFEKQYRFLCLFCDEKFKRCCVKLVDEHYQSRSESEKIELQLMSANSTEVECIKESGIQEREY